MIDEKTKELISAKIEMDAGSNTKDVVSIESH
jgi:hypothetical protein